MNQPKVHIDFETRSVVELTKVGLWNYARHPSTDVMCIGVAFDDDDPQLLICEEGQLVQGDRSLLTALRRHVYAKQIVIAHNAKFEYAIWNYCRHWQQLVKVELSDENLICTMARCYAMGLPGALIDAAPALGIDQAKDTVGHSLMMRLCKPANMAAIRKNPAIRPIWNHRADSFTFMGKKVSGAQAVKRLGKYCLQDVVVEREILKRTKPLSAFERKVWRVDHAINRRGVRFDLDAVRAGLHVRDWYSVQIDERMKTLTDGAVAKSTALPALKEWLSSQYGIEVDSLAKQPLDDLLQDATLPRRVIQVLELRQEANRLTSAAKLDKILDAADPADGRVRYLFEYGATGTGRFAGRLVQPHNFTRDLPPPEDVDRMMELIVSGEVELLEMLYGSPLTALSQCLRGLIVPAPGGKLVAGDWSNIEGRAAAWLAGEEWKLAAFRQFDAGTGPDIYVAAYSSVFDIPIHDVSKDQRQIGKVMELSMQYQGGVGAFQSMAGNYGVRVPDTQAEIIKVRWREKHPKIKACWFEIEDAAARAIANPGEVTAIGAPGRQVKMRKVGSFLWALLPSGRALCYPYPELRDGRYGQEITYKRPPSPEDRRRGRIIDDPTNTSKFARIGTYGGMLFENFVQALCRDVLVTKLVGLEDAGANPVFHVHDEAACEGRYDESHRAAVQKIMEAPLSWAKDLPLQAGCWIHHRYMKD